MAAIVRGSAPDDPGPKERGALSIGFEIEDGRRLRIRVSNSTGSPVQIHDSVTGDGGMPGFLDVMVRTTDGIAITKDSADRGAYRSLNFLESNYLIPPVTLTQLEAGARLERRVSLRDAMSSLARTVPTIDGVSQCEVRFRLRVFRDAALEKAQMSESPWFAVDLDAVRRAK